MKIVYQSEALDLAEELTLSEFMAQRGVKPEGIACAVNEEIVPKRQWSEFRLQDGMQVDIFNLVAGG